MCAFFIGFASKVGMGSAASATVREKFPDDAENLIREFQAAVMKAAGVQENSMCSVGGQCCPATQNAIQNLFDQADVNHDGKLDQQELISFIERLNFEMEDSLKVKLKENMKTVLLALTDDSMSVLFDQFMQCLSGCGPSLCESLIVSKDPKRIVFVGATGCGKSSLCTALTGHKKKGSPFKIGNRPSSETSECNAGTFRWFGEAEEEEFIIIDTPGLDDELGRDDDFINKIIDCMREVEYVNSIVLVVNAENLRFSTSLQKMIKHFEKAFSPRFYDHSIICLTKWYMDDDSIEEREEDGKTEESVSHELVKKICESPNLMCKGSLPVLFVDSFYEKRDPKHGKDRLRKIKESIGNTVFRTGDLKKLKPRIVELSNAAQVIRRGQAVTPMVPHLFDILETRNWECRPPLPEGLSCCAKKGRITGTPVSLSPLAEYQLFAESAGGWGEGFPFSLEVKHAESDIKGIVLNSLRPLQDKLEIWLPLEGPNIPHTEDDLKVMANAASEKSEALLGEIIEGLRPENESISTFTDIVTTLTQESERRVIQMQDEFAVEHQKKQLDAQRLRLKAEKDLEIQLIRETTNAEALRNYIRAAEVAGVNEELIGFGRAHLEKIIPYPCKHADLGCGVVLKKQSLEDHEAICLFGLPLFGKRSVQIKKSSPQSGGVVVKAVSGEGASWSGHYEYKVADDTYLLINRDLRRVQGLKKTDSDDPTEEELPWVFFFYTEADGPQTVVFSSTNSAKSVLDATFEEFELSVTEAYSWSDVAVPETPQKGSIKILYFGGKWCPYCP
jgi:GTPase SAR1 family protein